MATMASRWLFKKAFHCFAGSGFLGAFRIHLETVLSEMSKPSIVSSPCMRGAVEHVKGERWDGEEVHGDDGFAMVPQVRFSATMRKMSSGNSLLTHFLPAQ